ncbi:MAG: alpha/beta hydrolase [Acidobacteriaceae bacterium]|jgi:pimeloyl-ACP methyl ester carboxylesterase|nr:alpha/beta hydrolase [Acidobacteriaceae bacterium]
MTHTLFLPGATGNADFWKPVAQHAHLDGVFFAWPGLGDEPARPDVNGLDDLVAMVAHTITAPVNLVAQSMGGVVAIKLALAMPTLVNRLVLTATSGGVPMANLGGADWRSSYFAAFPRAARWIADPVGDLSNDIPSITQPTLLLWGDVDPISPVAVGTRLLSLLPKARLHVVPGADHDLARTHAEAVAIEVMRHLA